MRAIAGVMRDTIFSPNNIDKDSAIFNAVVDELRQRGCTVNIYSETELQQGVVKERTIINMCRDLKSIATLKALEQLGVTVINSAYGIENCTRERMTQLLSDGGIPSADSVIVDTDCDLTNIPTLTTFSQYWVKRGDFHAVEREDVSFCTSIEQVKLIINSYAKRGIKRAVINKHLTGDLVKFYGVQDTDFLYWFYPLEAGHSKYGDELINGKSKGYKFDTNYLKQICQDASLILNVAIYGGDCVVGEDGSIQIIDFNDFPSFSPCREIAATYITEHIITKLKL